MADEIGPQAAEEYWRAAFAILLEEGRRDIDNQLRELSELGGPDLAAEIRSAGTSSGASVEVAAQDSAHTPGSVLEGRLSGGQVVPRLRQVPKDDAPIVDRQLRVERVFDSIFVCTHSGTRRQGRTTWLS
jgi:hypothetical protein